MTTKVVFEQLEGLFAHCDTILTKGDVTVEFNGRRITLRGADFRSMLVGIRQREEATAGLSLSLRRVINL